jgi:hypothetical protein
MTSQPRETPPAVWFVTLMPCMLAGCVMAISWAVDWPLVESIAVGIIAIGALVFGVLAFIDGRATGRGFWRSLGQGVWTAFRAFLHFIFF